MVRHISLPVIFGLLIWGFVASPDFSQIAAGVAIFLFGMLFLEDGFRAFTGGALERALKKATGKIWQALTFGIVSTSIVQSSSLVSIITISFLSAEMISLTSGLAIVFGANLGTTTGAWLVAGIGLKINIAAYAMPMLVFGIILVFQNSRTLKGAGYILAGLGFLFLGIHFMKEGFEAARSTIDLAQFALTGFGGLLVFALVGVVATVVMQSSHATLVLIITALAAGQITYENALALAIGANVGTTITAILGSLSSTYQGRRLAAGHVIFNVITGLVAIVFIHQLAWLVDGSATAFGIGAENYTLKLALFHTIFNVIGVALMLPFMQQLVDQLERMIPTPLPNVVQPKYLVGAVVDFPETMVEAVRNETLRLYDKSFTIILHGLNLHRTQIYGEDELEAVIRRDREVFEFDLDASYDESVKALHGAIIDFISRTHGDMPVESSEQLYALRRACAEIVRAVKDIKHLRKNIMRYIVSDNTYMRDEYNNIRIQIASLIRDIHELREQDEDERSVVDLDIHRVTAEALTRIENGDLDLLIREGTVSPQMGTSLINDYGYARDAIERLTEAAKILLGAREAKEMIAEELIALDDEDVAELAESVREEAEDA